MKRVLSKKLTALKKKLLDNSDFKKLEAEIAPELARTALPVYAVFLSVCNKKERARVFRCAAPSVKEAWEGACSAADRYITAKDYDPHWIKADIMCKSEKTPLADVITEISKGYNEFFRRGIAFDEELKTALIEAEINGNRVISYKKKTIELTAVNKYLSKACEKTLTELPESVLLFDCISAFCDEDDNAYSLYSDGLDVGRRNVGEISKQSSLDVIVSSSEFLSMMVGAGGKFDYGFYPIYHKEIPGYNIMRHASSIWSLLCAYRLTGDTFTLRQAEEAIAYMVNNTYNKYNLPPEKENTVYLAELSKNEVKVGANGVAIIMLTEYMDIIRDTRLKKLCVELGNGILELFDERNGEFFHVLNFPKLNPKEKFRTVYYDGECLFALCRLYGLTGDKRWLNAAEKAADRFIRDNYVQHGDHWAAYAINELTKYSPKEKYFEFGLRNVQENLKKIGSRKTTYHTYLELLCVSYELYSRINEEKHKVSYIDKFDVNAFVKTIFKRAEHMLNGYGYPEYVMYFKYPEQSLGAFFIRHDGYRIRIDDIQHFCGAYYSFYRNYDKLSELRRSLGEEC